MDVSKNVYKIIKNGSNKINNIVTFSVQHLFDIMFTYLYI